MEQRRLSDADHARLLLVIEQERRVKAEQDLVQLRRVVLVERLQRDYGVKDTEVIDVNTGAIEESKA